MKFTNNKKGIGMIIFRVGFALSAICSALIFLSAFFLEDVVLPVFADRGICILVGIGVFLLGSIIAWSVGVIVESYLEKHRNGN